MAIDSSLYKPNAFIDTVRRNFCMAGYPVKSLTVDSTEYELNHEPDKKISLSSSVFLNISYSEKSFTSPVFRWEFEDGRRFQARPECDVKVTKHRAWPCTWETAEFDDQKMMKNLYELVKSSYDDI